MSNDARRIAVLDFETADNQTMMSAQQVASACFVCWQVVETDGHQVRLLENEGGSTFIRPPQNRFTGWDEHGISATQTCDAPPLLGFWKEQMQPRLAELGVTTLAAHNVGFHARVLSASLRHREGIRTLASGKGFLARRRARRDLETLAVQLGCAPDGSPWSWACTLQWAKRSWPAQQYGLDVLARELDIGPARRDVTQDARTTATLMARLAVSDHLCETFELDTKHGFAVAQMMSGGSHMHLAAVLMACDVRGLGRETCEAIAERFQTLDVALTATAAELEALPGIGKVKAQAVLEALASPANRARFDALRDGWVTATQASVAALPPNATYVPEVQRPASAGSQARGKQSGDSGSLAATDRQLNYIASLAEERGMDVDDAIDRALGWDAWKMLNRRRASAVIDWLLDQDDEDDY